MKPIKTSLNNEQRKLDDQENLIKTSLIINSICFIQKYLVRHWVGGCKSRFKDCLQQSKIANQNLELKAKSFAPFWAI